MYSREKIAAGLMAMRKKKKMADGGEAGDSIGTMIGYPGSPPPKPKKMADGGMVEDDDDFRSLGELSVEGAEHPNEIANPEEQSEEQSLARALHKQAMAEAFAMGGLVQPEHGMDTGNRPDENMASQTEEPMSSEPMKPESKGISEEAMQALADRKKKRRFA